MPGFPPQGALYLWVTVNVIFIFKLKKIFFCSVSYLLKSYPTLFKIPWTVANQTPLFLGFPRQEYWSGMWSVDIYNKCPWRLRCWFLS